MMPHPLVRRRPNTPFRVLCSLVYNRFIWIEHAEDGTMTIPTARYAKQLELRSHALREALARLKEIDMLEYVSWHDTYFKVRVACPPRFARLVGPQPKLNPADYPFAQLSDFAKGTIDV